MGEMLRNNFEGNEIERLRLANGAPRFGNDDDYADEIAVKLFETYTAGVRRQNEKRRRRPAMWIMCSAIT